MEAKELFELALQEHTKKNFISAEKLYKKILEKYPNELSTLNNLGTVLKELGKNNEAVSYYEKALELKPEDIITNYNLGILFSKLEEFQKSIIFYEKVIKTDPTHFQSYHNLLDIYEKTNNHEKLKETVEKAKSYLKNNPTIKLYEGNLLYKKEKFNEAIKNLETISFDLDKIKQEQLRVLTLGRSYEKTNNFDKAFKSFVKANEISFKLKNKNINKDFYLEKIKIRKQFFTKLNKEEWSLLKLPNLEKNPIFMVGFPRSGTTLLDNILSGHPSIEVIEEKSMVPKLIGSLNQLTNNDLNNLKNINAEQIQKLRSNYFEDLYSHVKNKNILKIYIDKLPLNIIYIGEIFKIFPQAKFIFSVRHPRDCVLSCFIQNFAINNAMANFFNLEDSAKLYNFIMELWTKYITIFQINYHEVKYENLVENLENTSRQLLNFLELPWDDNVLKFFETAKQKKQIKTPSYDQVIKPIYLDSTERWKMYKKQISNSFDILEPWIKKFKYK